MTTLTGVVESDRDDARRTVEEIVRGYDDVALTDVRQISGADVGYYELTVSGWDQDELQDKIGDPYVDTVGIGYPDQFAFLILYSGDSDE